MTDKAPTFRERGIATGVNNVAGLRDLVIDLAAEIDKLVPEAQPPEASADEAETAETETETN